MKNKPRTFEEFPDHAICPVCGTNDKGECILVSIDGTEDEDNKICEASPTHLWCAISTNFNKDIGVMYIKVKE